jgi:hypothetical protein
MVKLRRIHFADAAGIVLALLLIIVGLAALARPESMVIFHPAGDITGGSAGGVIEGFSPQRVRFYGSVALILGIGLSAFLVWALKTDEDDAI